jgi:hypothetical protein
MSTETELSFPWPCYLQPDQFLVTCSVNFSRHLFKGYGVPIVIGRHAFGDQVETI